MKHLTKQEAIGRMMLAYATLIEQNFQCELLWYPSVKQSALSIYLGNDEEEPQLQILTHPDFNSSKRILNEYDCCISYTWDCEEAPV